MTIQAPRHTAGLDEHCLSRECLSPECKAYQAGWADAAAAISYAVNNADIGRTVNDIIGRISVVTDSGDVVTVKE